MEVNNFNLPYIAYLSSHVIVIIVGSDYSTLAGNEDITAVFSKGSNSAIVEILIHLDVMDEDAESFTAELQSEPSDTSTSATIIIKDTTVVLCTFGDSEYTVYESVGSVNLTLISNKIIPHSNYTVQVETVLDIGNASGEI